MKKGNRIGKTYKTEFKNGIAKLVAYNAHHDAFKSESGLWWKFESGLLTTYAELRPVDK